MSELLPLGPELFTHNRRVLAERLNWPPGAEHACQTIDRQYPGWHSSYWHAFRDNPAGYYAFHDEPTTWMEPHLYGATADQLRKAIEAHRCPARWRQI